MSIAKYSMFNDGEELLVVVERVVGAFCSLLVELGGARPERGVGRSIWGATGP